MFESQIEILSVLNEIFSLKRDLLTICQCVGNMKLNNFNGNEQMIQGVGVELEVQTVEYEMSVLFVVNYTEVLRW